MAKILITAENFAFGPIGKILIIAEILKESKHELYFAGYGTSLQLARKFQFENIISVDTDDKRNEDLLKNLISEFELVISSMDIPTIKIANKLKVPTVWVDCLFWFWDDLPKEVLEVDLFIKENLFDDNDKKSRYSAQINNLLNVGPIIGKPPKKTKKKNQLLISYGGGEATHSYKIGKDTNYPSVMTKILISHIDLKSFDKIIIGTNERTVKNLQFEYSKTDINYVCLPYEKFIQEIADSKFILSTPGLVTAEIAFEYKTPIIFLPASNNSQYMQLERFRSLNIAPASIHMSDYISKLDLNKLPVDQSTQLVLDQLKILERSEKLQKQIGSKINYYLNNKNDWSIDAVLRGKRYIDKMGGNGAIKASESIRELIEKINE